MDLIINRTVIKPDLEKTLEFFEEESLLSDGLEALIITMEFNSRSKIFMYDK